MKKNNLLDHTIQAKSKKLKLAKGGVDKAMSLRTQKVQNAGLMKGLKVSQSTQAGNRGVKVSGNGKSTTIVLKTNYVQSGYNYQTGKTTTNKQVGEHAGKAVSYVERDGASKDIDNSESNLYDRHGERLSHEDYAELQEKLNEGVEAFRRFEFSPGLDMSREELVEAVSNAVENFNSQYGKNVETHFAVHTNTDNIHAHIFMEGSKSDIKMSKEQLQAFKVDLGIEVAAVLNEKDLSRDFDKDLEREIHNLDRMKDLSEIKNAATEAKNDIRSELREDLQKEFNKQTQNISFDKKELDQIKTLQKAEGAAQYAEKKNDFEKVEKMQSWKSSILDKMNDTTKEKLASFDKAVEDFKSSRGAERLKDQADEKLLSATKAEADQLKSIGFKKAADSVMSKQREENKKDLKFSKDQALEAKEKELDQKTKESDRTKEVSREETQDTTRTL